jgi:Thiol-activated cytolysin
MRKSEESNAVSNSKSNKVTSRRSFLTKFLLIGGSISAINAFTGCGGGAGNGNKGNTNSTPTPTPLPTPTPIPSSGGNTELGRLITSSRLLDATYKASSEPTPSSGAPESTDQINVSGGKTVFAVGKPGNYTEGEIRSLQNLIPFISTEYTYPGSIIQGKKFEEGGITPVRIARGSGVITLTGPIPQKNQTTSRSITKMDKASIEDAVNQLRSQGFTSTPAKVIFQIFTADSLEQIGFALKVDARYKIVSGKVGYDFKSEKKKNRYVAFFSQVYYSISVALNDNPGDAFAPGAINNGDIAPDNPPLIHSSIDYGRMYFLVIDTYYSKSDVSAILDIAVAGGIFGGNLNSKFTMDTVANDMAVTFTAIGGDAPETNQIAQHTDDAIKTFNAVKSLIANKKLSETSEFNAALPIAYTLRYLKSGDVAAMGYSVDYTKREWDLMALDSSLYLQIKDNTGFIFLMRPDVNGTFGEKQYDPLTHDYKDPNDPNNGPRTDAKLQYYPRTSGTGKIVIPIPGSVKGMPLMPASRKEIVRMIIYRENGKNDAFGPLLRCDVSFLRRNLDNNSETDIGGANFNEIPGKNAISNMNYRSTDGTTGISSIGTTNNGVWGPWNIRGYSASRPYLKHAYYILDWEIDWQSLTVKYQKATPYWPDMWHDNKYTVYYDNRDDTIQYALSDAGGGF